MTGRCHRCGRIEKMAGLDRVASDEVACGYVYKVVCVECAVEEAPLAHRGAQRCADCGGYDPESFILVLPGESRCGCPEPRTAARTAGGIPIKEETQHG